MKIKNTKRHFFDPPFDSKKNKQATRMHVTGGNSSILNGKRKNKNEQKRAGHLSMTRISINKKYNVCALAKLVPGTRCHRNFKNF